MMNIKNPMISVIVPAYNAEKTIQRCLDSLLHQTYPQVEVIVVNDGSTDETLNICRQYHNDARLVVIDQPNSGVSRARNTGLDHASGDFVMFCDSDDWVELNYCECFFCHFEQGSLLFADLQECKRGETISVSRYDRKEAMRLRGHGMESPWAKLFDSTVIRENKLRFPEDIALGEDFIFVLAYIACIQGSLIKLSRSMYHYENTESDSLSRKTPSLEQTASFYRLLKEQAQKIGICDAGSLFILERSIMLDLEKLILIKSKDKSARFTERYRQVKAVMSSDVYHKTCKAGVGSANRLYECMFQRQMAFFLTLYYALIGG